MVVQGTPLHLQAHARMPRIHVQENDAKSHKVAGQGIHFREKTFNENWLFSGVPTHGGALRASFEQVLQPSQVRRASEAANHCELPGRRPVSMLAAVACLRGNLFRATNNHCELRGSIPRGSLFRCSQWLLAFEVDRQRQTTAASSEAAFEACVDATVPTVPACFESRLLRDSLLEGFTVACETASSRVSLWLLAFEAAFHDAAFLETRTVGACLRGSLPRGSLEIKQQLRAWTQTASTKIAAEPCCLEGQPLRRSMQAEAASKLAVNACSLRKAASKANNSGKHGRTTPPEVSFGFVLNKLPRRKRCFVNVF